MDDVVDRADPLDAHDAVPTERLLPWLGDALGVSTEDIALGRFGRGWSNLTFLLTVGGRELVLRRGPPGVQIARAHDMLREARILQGVGRVYPKVPAVVAMCDDPEVLGGTFYVMDRMHGVILRDRQPKGLALEPPTMRALSEAMVDTLAEIHGLDLSDAGLSELGRPEGYVARQVAGWTKRYIGSQTDEIEDMTWLAAWLEQHRPDESAATLIHNDFKYDNVMLDADDVTRVIAVLDWEMATVGDPLLDLGTMLAYWVQADDPPGLQMFRLCLTDRPGNLTRREIVERYAERRGLDALDPVWPFVFGAFKNAVVAQQLYARFARGLTRETRYEGMIWAVRGLSAVARQAAEQHRIDRFSV